MCRIAAIISKDTDTITERIGRMTAVMQHGGPDDEGVCVHQSLGFGFGHRRLSIIDTSTAGHQPMYDAAKRYVISFNGEIFNYKELRNNLTALGYEFETGTDTEVLLAGYAVWGAGLLTKLEGMFSFIIADLKKEELFIARDHMGIKPLYMGKRGGDYYFSSEVKGLTAVDADWEPNLEWRIWFLTFGFLPEPITTLQNVWPVRKGHYIVFDLKENTYSEYCWFKENYQADSQIDMALAIAQTKQMVERAVKKHLVADVEIGVFLSGGIDSSIIATLAAAYSDRAVKTISIDFEDTAYSERQYQDLVAERINCNHNRYIVKKEDFVASWKDIYQSIDQPTTDAINSHFICRYAKELGLKVVLSGLGADELFGGYPSFHRTEQFKHLQRISILYNGLPNSLLPYPQRKLGYLQKKMEAGEYLLYRGLFTPSDVADIMQITEQKVWETISRYKLPVTYKNIPTAKSRVSAYELDIYMLNQLLKDADVQSMWHGLELRVPFLDINLVKFIQGLPDKIKYPNKEHKYLLVQAFKDILPGEILNRKKQGFTFPFDEWLGSLPVFKNGLYVPKHYYKKFQTKKINYSRLWGIYLSRTFGNIGNFEEVKQPIQPDTLFLYLTAFGKTGGIEKMNKVIMHSLHMNDDVFAQAYSLHDDLMDSRYFHKYYFRGFSAQRFKFLVTLMRNSKKWKQVIVGHLNLAPAVFLMRLINPQLRIVVMVHGIEAWHRQKRFPFWLLQKAQAIISVSNFTREQLIQNSGVTGDKIKVLPNCLDPFFKSPEKTRKAQYLKERYNLKPDDKVVLTITRMSNSEKYKGYDQVLLAISKFSLQQLRNIKYILAGKADADEARRIHLLVEYYGLQQHVLIPGFIPVDELQDHYQLADVFIMPSRKEGFGLVLIEAAASGTPVIAGNCDGSVEALQHGELGQLIDPEDISSIQAALNTALKVPQNLQIKNEALQVYSAGKYKMMFKKILATIICLPISVPGIIE